MKLTMITSEIASYTMRQMQAFFPDGKSISGPECLSYVQEALDRVEFCFQRIAWSAYSEDGQAKFDVLHSDQYCIYLYFLSNSIFRQGGDTLVAKKLFYLNKSLHAFNCMYDTYLPDIFCMVHCVGTVLGKAQYSNFFVACQNCTIGALAGHYPVLGEKVILSAGASIIGGCNIGDNVMLAPGCTVFKTDIPTNSLVSNASDLSANQELRIKHNTDRPIQTFFRL